MSDMKWTPGPWELNGSAVVSAVKLEDRGKESIKAPVASVVNVWNRREENEANAHLITTSPRLYRALSLMVTTFSDGPIKHSDDAKASAIQHALDAMAEARGQS